MKYSLGAAALAASCSFVSVSASAILYGQCGGIYYTGDTTCVAGAVCVKTNDYYSQCLPAKTTTTTRITTSSPIPTTTKTTSATPTVTACSTSTPPAGAGTFDHVGINIAGFDFGCGVDGLCTPKDIYAPLAQYYGPDGVGQMQHFANDDKFNTFRLPVGWQYLTNSVLGGPLDPTYFAKYNELVSGCLSVGPAVSCIIDIHNYARWNGTIIGQGGPADAQFADLWKQLATFYKDEPRVIFGLMNEPHDVPDITIWAASVQTAVTAIRNAGATRQMILLPGNNWTSAELFVSNGSADALSKVKNPDGSITGLIFDVHKYLDLDNSGTHVECTTNNIDSTFAPLAQWLRCHGRRAFLTETGGGNVDSCITYMCQQVAFMKANSDVYLGYVGWGAGSFDSTYTLTETPTNNGGVWTDTPLVASCLKP